MSFPATTPSYAASDNTMTLDEFNHLTRHTDMQNDLIGLSGKLGTGVSTPTSGQLLLGNGTGTSAWTSAASIYPIGTIYTNKTNSANPSTYLLGQTGTTWVAITDTFIVAAGSTYTAGTAYGSATHSHNLAGTAFASLSVESTTIFVDRAVGSLFTYDRGITTSLSSSAQSGDSATSINTTGATNDGSTIPPSVAAYCWERTL